MDREKTKPTSDKKPPPLLKKLELDEMKRVIEIPEISLQKMIDAGMNGFGLLLFMKSIKDKKDSATFKPFSFIYKDVKVTLAPKKNLGVLENG